MSVFPNCTRTQWLLSSTTKPRFNTPSDLLCHFDIAGFLRKQKARLYILNLCAIMAFGQSGKDVETSSIDSESKHVHSNSSQATDAKLDKRGIPLVPQPTSDPLDPLNWTLWLKILVLLQVSLLAFLALFSASLIASPPSAQPEQSGLRANMSIRHPPSSPSPNLSTKT